MTEVRIATFNVENLDEVPAGAGAPSLEQRVALMQPQIVRLRGDVVCFQEVHGQERPGKPRALLALHRLIAGTELATANICSTKPAGDAVYDLPDGRPLHVINVHLKSKIPTTIAGQKVDSYTWKSADAWAEGVFVSSMKRVSQALEVRRLIDAIMDEAQSAGEEARVVVGHLRFLNPRSQSTQSAS